MRILTVGRSSIMIDYDEDSEDDQGSGDHTDEGLHGHSGDQVNVSGLMSGLGVMVRSLGLGGD